MDGKIPPQEQAHDQPPSLSEANILLAKYLRDHIDGSHIEKVPDVIPSDDPFTETFFIKIPGVDDIIEVIERLEKTPFDERLFDKKCIEVFDAKTYEIGKLKLSQHENAIRRGQVTIFNEDESDEEVVNIAAKYSDEFREAQKQAILDSSIIEDTDLPLEKDAQTVQSIVDASIIHFGSIAKKAIALLPDKDALFEDIKNGQINIFDVFTHNFLKPQELSFAADNRDIRNFKRAVRKLCDSLQAYIDSPETALADISMSAVGDTIDESITNDIQDRIVRANTKLYAEKQTPKSEKIFRDQSTEEKLSKREKRLLESIARAATNEEVTTIDVRDHDARWLKAIHRATVGTSWLEKQEREVEELITSNGSVYILDAISDELVGIRDETLAKNKELEHKILVKIDTAAEKIAHGNLPWNTYNGFKRLHVGTEVPDEYNDEAIYYLFDKSPNAPRIYFTMKRAADIEVILPGNTAILKPEQWCMTIVAITDKDQQIATLKQLTGRTTSQLRADGAGSI